ncbi:glycoside hydrolase family 61 protein [Xylaria scruposa]|nr:glycoside hydrolase family 61 protein [Xylaria scruposa]
MLVSLLSLVALMGAFANTALAHGNIVWFKSDGVTNPGLLWYYWNDWYYYDKPYPKLAAWFCNDSDGFVSPDRFNTSDINCYPDAVPAPLTATVKAGENVTFHYETSTGGGWPHEQGPIFTYIANCHGNCSTIDHTKLEWVKIDAAGYDTASKKWASQNFRANNSTWTTTVPASIAPGNYVFRHEIIALHLANQPNGAQAYPKCLNIEITGSGTKTPSGTLGTELYKADDPGIAFNPYQTFTSYPMPGPALFTG